MKKIAFIILVASILSACLSTPSQLTVTPEVTPTLPPTLIPTPTFHPQFIILQESIAASGTRFSLQPDGLIYDGDTPVPGVIVTPDGTVFLTVDGDKEIVIERDGYSFDDEEGFTVNGMEWDEETGAWVEANETITLGGVTMTLDENGVVTEMSVEGNYTEEQKAEKMEAVDPTHWGFEPGEAQIVKGEDGKMYLTPSGEPETKIASWYYASGEWEWNGAVLDQLEGGNPLFDFANTWEMKGKNPADIASAHVDSAEMLEFANQNGANVGITHLRPIYIYNEDNPDEAIAAVAMTRGTLFDEAGVTTKQMTGWICIKTEAGLELVRVRDLEVVKRAFN